MGWVDLSDPEAPAPDVGSEVMVMRHDPLRGVVVSIVGSGAFAQYLATMLSVPVVASPPHATEAERLRYKYQSCSVPDGFGGYRGMTLDEMRAEDERGAKKRWVEVEFADGTRGLFSRYMLPEEPTNLPERP